MPQIGSNFLGHADNRMAFYFDCVQERDIHISNVNMQAF